MKKSSKDNPSQAGPDSEEQWPMQTAPANTALSVYGLTKRFGDFTALDSVDFDLRPGEIHALLGENGAGKSTMMNILRGLIRPSGGRISVHGAEAKIASPRDATALGIGMVHQHFLLVPVLSVIDNLILAARQKTLLRDRATVLHAARETATSLGWDLPFDARIADLPVGAQQRVEILKALQGQARILLFDEPTAVLTPGETIELFRVLRTLRDQGRSLVFVSHKLTEVMDLCDRVTVLRRGKQVGSVDISQTNPRDLAARMVGEGVVSQYEDELLTQNAASIIPATNDGDFAPVLAIDGLSADKLGKDDTRLDDLTFAVGAGGVLAIAGVDGNGQEELFEVLSGLRPFGSNSFQLSGEPVDRLAPGSLSARRIAVIPPDRRRQGLALPLTTAENLTLEAARMPQFRIGPLLRRKALFELASRLRREFDVRSPSLRTPSALLSGGNQQKIVIARALWRRPKLLVAASPTRGLDVAATAYVHAKIRECTRAGTAVVLISTELDEIYALATRIAVLYAGRIVGIVGPDAPRETIGQMMGGSYSR